MAINETALEILLRNPRRDSARTPIIDPVTDKLVQGRISTETNARHQFLSWYPHENFSTTALPTDGREILFPGNVIYVPRIPWPYNLPSFNNNHCWVSFNGIKTGNIFSFVGSRIQRDERGILLQSGTRINREFDSFRIYTSGAPLQFGLNYFTAANFLPNQSSAFMLYYGNAIDLDMNSYYAQQDSFIITFAFTLPAVLTTGSFTFNVPYQENFAKCYAWVDDNVNTVNLDLIRGDMKFGNDIVVDSLIFPASTAPVQQTAIAQTNLTQRYVVEVTAGGAAETGIAVVSLIWLPSGDSKEAYAP